MNREIKFTGLKDKAEKKNRKPPKPKAPEPRRITDNADKFDWYYIQWFSLFIGIIVLSYYLVKIILT